MAAITDAVVTSRVPINGHWMVTGYGTATTDSYIDGGVLRLTEVTHPVYASRRSATVASNPVGAVINSDDGTEGTLRGALWLTAASTAVVDFCVIGR